MPATKHFRAKRRGPVFVYILQSSTDPKKSYVGVTQDLTRRLRQHNGKIVGGARYTRRFRPWTFHSIFQVRSRSDALSLEWRIKHRKSKNDGKGIEGIVNTALRLGLKFQTFEVVQIAQKAG